MGRGGAPPKPCGDTYLGNPYPGDGPETLPPELKPITVSQEGTERMIILEDYRVVIQMRDEEPDPQLKAVRASLEDLDIKVRIKSLVRRLIDTRILTYKLVIEVERSAE